jgi:hypothetical protein
LRLPGQSIQAALDGELWDGFFPYFIAAVFFTWAAVMECRFRRIAIRFTTA